MMTILGNETRISVRGELKDSSRRWWPAALLHFAPAMGVAGALPVCGVAAYWLPVKEPVTLEEEPRTA